MIEMTRFEQLSFLLTNRIPRHLVTRFVGWVSQIQNPIVTAGAMGLWRLFTEVDLTEARETHFRSLHDCFIRELKPGVRPIDADPAVLTSPCDAIVGACGAIDGITVVQAKGFPYSLAELLPDPALVERYRDGQYVTLRLTSSMYHRFHAPHDLRVNKVNYISGDTWNTHPITLKRVEKLFCKNERAVIQTTLARGGHAVTLVPVASILVASIRFHFIDVVLRLAHRGPYVFACDARYRKGEEMGWFHLGSTIIVFAPRGFALCDGIEPGHEMKMGERLLRLPA
jgi:phosphatidylserine decarboxylase